MKTKKKKELVHSYSVENYSDVLNKSLSNYNENLEKLENSKIMEVKFIRGMRDTKRKDSLIKAIEKYKRFKSLGKVNINDLLNNSFTLGCDQNKYRQKSIERIYSMKNSYNIIEEDENENSDNDTIRKKSDSKINKVIDEINTTNNNNNTNKNELHTHKGKEDEKNNVEGTENCDKRQKVKDVDIKKKHKLMKLIKRREDDDNFGKNNIENNIKDINNNIGLKINKDNKINNKDFGLEIKKEILNKDINYGSFINNDKSENKQNNIFLKDKYIYNDKNIYKKLKRDINKSFDKKGFDAIKENDSYNYLDIYKELSENNEKNFSKILKNDIQIFKELNDDKNYKKGNNLKDIEKIIYKNSFNNKNKSNFINIDYYENNNISDNNNNNNSNCNNNKDTSQYIKKTIKNEITKFIIEKKIKKIIKKIIII